MYKVHYFGGYGAAEPIRLLLAHAKQPFENVDYTQESLAEAKKGDTLEFKQLPVLEVEGKFYAQSHAILRLLGHKLNYYPTDHNQAFLVDSLLDSFKDFVAVYAKASWAQDEEEKKKLFAAFFETTFPNWCAVIEKRLIANSSQKYIVGNSQTIGDFILCTFGFSMVFNEANPGKAPLQEAIAKFPVFSAYLEAQREENKEYLSTRRVSPW
ncbi:hypothetical protein FGO68_gene2480 [Halteria grandinella]|uniref:GST N-terminal domain-containing protein n=1 Tax=Halteria grandinella TaxID=5974 RepID=A0A8J8NJW9_HALGN|nr:hypothetical protein FGO68_gene2480 [Halteria grandinella]